jgi:hypothetical protein
MFGALTDPCILTITLVRTTSVLQSDSRSPRSLSTSYIIGLWAAGPGPTVHASVHFPNHFPFWAVLENVGLRFCTRALTKMDLDLKFKRRSMDPNTYSESISHCSHSPAQVPCSISLHKSLMQIL